MQAWWAAGSVMLTQGSSACACAGGMQRGASAMTAAADAPISAFFISSSFPEPPNGRRVVATDTRLHFVMRSYEFRQVALIVDRRSG